MNLQFTTTKDAKTFVAAKMQEILREFGVTVTVPWSTRVSDLDSLYNLDSLDQIELIMCLEEELEMEISDEDLEKCPTIEDILSLCIRDYRIALPDTAPTPKVATTNPPVDKLKALPPYNNDIGILLLPSLEQHGRMIQVKSVSVNEALEMVDQFTKKVTICRKTKEYKNYADGEKVNNMQLFSNIIDSSEMSELYVKDPKYLDADLTKLFESKVPKTRGFRPIFVSNTVIGVGTTVIYNQNWATVNFEDDSILVTLQRIQEKYKKPEEKDEDSSYYSSYDSSW